MILSAQSIAEYMQQGQPLLTPFHDRMKKFGMTYGLGPAGYDVRLAEDVTLYPVNLKNLIVNLLADWLPWVNKRPSFSLAATLEYFRTPSDLTFKVEDKSTWARRGLSVQNTTGEPGWNGFLTLELNNHGEEILFLKAGMPIAQIVYHRLDQPTMSPYDGRYQNQGYGAQPAKLLEDSDESC